MTTTKNKPNTNQMGDQEPTDNGCMNEEANSASEVHGMEDQGVIPEMQRSAGAVNRGANPSYSSGATAISLCVQEELARYFDMLDGEKPAGLYRMVIRQAEHALLSTVMRECGGNQSRAAEWLGISRGNLRKKLADMDDASQ